MSYKIFTLGIIWLCLSIIVTVIFSTQDKEWWIGEENIKNICDLMAYVENDDIRGFGMLITFPIFLPALYAFLIKKAHHGFLYLITILSQASGYGDLFSGTSFVLGKIAGKKASH